MKKHPLPYHHLLDQIQLLIPPIAHELPVIQSLLKWILKTLKKDHQMHPMGWMLVHEGKLWQEEQTLKLIRIQECLKELQSPLHVLFIHVRTFTQHHKKIEEAIVALNGAFHEIPLIENELNKLREKPSLFDQPELTEQLFFFTERVREMLTKTSTLKQIMLDEMVQSLSLNIQDSLKKSIDQTS